MSTTRTWLILAAAGALLLAAAACDDSETIAPDGSTITLTANPAQIILTGGVQQDPVTILAMVRNSIGMPLPGQDVRFTSTYGELTPPGGTPVATDDLGNATCQLNGATSGPAITATSGKATASITLNSSTCQIQDVVLNPTTQLLETCQDTFEYTATVTCSNGQGAANVKVTFSFKDVGDAFLTGTFVPGQGNTDANGELTTTLSFDTTNCNARCPGNNCTTDIQATSGTITSDPSVINDGIQ